MQKLKNLIDDPWIPIRRESGKHELIAPWQVTETKDPIISIDALRPDFNGALMQFLIGLLQTTVTPDNHDKWVDWLEEPPSPESLKKIFSKYSHAFELQNKHGSFMQDFDELEDALLKTIAKLLIDYPGGNTIKTNTDHFIKRGGIEKLCVSCTATALFSLQTNAPGGGQGHRTSLRGGGPLTTLVLLDEQSDLPSDLWRNIWLNELDLQQLNSLSGDESKQSLDDIFPWLAPTRTSEESAGCETTPIDTHPLQMYWGMPRRISIQWQSGLLGDCDLCHVYSDQLITHYRTKPHGVNYSGAWQHPLSPHAMHEEGNLLPLHVQPGGITYQHWSRLALSSDNEQNYSNAAVVNRYRRFLSDINAEHVDQKEQFILTAFGYDTDNAKVRCWYEHTFPLINVPSNIRIEFEARVQVLTETSEKVARFVRSCIKESWFNRPADAKGDISFLLQAFYQHTENDFYIAIKALPANIADSHDKDILNRWHTTLQKAAFKLFDYWAIRGDFTHANPRRIASARDKLKGLIYSKKIKQALLMSEKIKEVA